MPKKEIEGCGIVLIGLFNPLIFTPSWLALEGLIRKTEAHKAEVKVIHRDITAFSLDWMELEVSRERFKVNTTNSAYFEVLRDLCVGIFTLLRHTPLKAVGINFDFHLNTDIETSNRFFSIISPLEPWNNIFTNPKQEEIIIKGERTDKHSGHWVVRINRSTLVNDGVKILVNDHYELDVDPEKSTSKKISNRKDDLPSDLVEILVEGFDQSRKTSENILERLWKNN